MGGRRALARDDLRNGASGGSGVRPGVMQMLFGGGETASADMRTGRNSVMPSDKRMLFKGGVTAERDLRTGRADDLDPDDEEMLAEGGEVDDALDEDVDEGLIVAAEDIMDCMGDSYIGRAPGPDDSKIERATKEASRRAKAKILAQALKSFIDQTR